MAVVIRLQGLRITAGSEDIRNFFSGLRIPNGGVHIIGGKLEEAFIIFVSDEDARRAMSRSGGCIKGSPVNLFLSSKTEMQKVLEDSTRTSEANENRFYKEGAKRSSMAVEGRPPPFKKEIVKNNKTSTSPLSSQDLIAEGASDKESLYLKLCGMPFSATENDVRNFLDGLQVKDIIFLTNYHGQFNGDSLVKFATKEDAREGLKRDLMYIGPRYVKIKMCSEKEWVEAGGFVQTERSNQRTRSSSRTRSRSPLHYQSGSKSRSRSPSNEEYCVLYENLSHSVEKPDIKALLHNVFLKDDQIVIFEDQNRENTKSAVVVFRNLKDYCSGLAHHKEMFLHRLVCVSPISKEKLATILASSSREGKEGRRSSRSSERSQKSSHGSERRCVYVRNMPSDVRKIEVMDFFHEFQLSEDRVVLLHDETGTGLGEALVIFHTQKEALMAQSLNGQRFLGSKVILVCITLAQMHEFGVNPEIIGKTMERNSRRNPGGFGESSNYSYQNEQDVMPDGSLGNFQHSDAFGQASYGGGTGSHQYGQYGPPDQQFDGPTCLKLLNLPTKIQIDEIYDFCYGYRVIPGSVSLQYDGNGFPIGSATVVFENYSEAVTAIHELNGRPIGTRKIKIVFV
ncbi:RNA binding motif protein 12Bb [Hoplias malabaricus]|uniref:RNA binding motif protein 12Bb n=1 Tax=Hoplias malabaricus TaxID=27720 RepID=UPI003461B7FB